jgi:hypothetical protein
LENKEVRVYPGSQSCDFRIYNFNAGVVVG